MLQVDVLAKMAEQSIGCVEGRLAEAERRLSIIEAGNSGGGGEGGSGSGRGQGWVFWRLWRWVGSHRKRGQGDTVFKA